MDENSLTSPRWIAVLVVLGLVLAAGCDMPPSVATRPSDQHSGVTPADQPTPAPEPGLPAGQVSPVPEPSAPPVSPPVRPDNNLPPPAGSPPQRVGSSSGVAPGTPGGAPISTPQSGSRASALVKLSAGVALPQSLPTGTTMGFSVDYTVLGRLPTSGGNVVWVIQSAKGLTAEFPIQLKPRGNLMTFAEGMRPEQGPFQSWIAVVRPDGRREEISRKIALKSP